VTHAQCCICGTNITERFWACEACERGYNLPRSYAEWPGWAKLLQRDEATRRRRRDHEIQVIPISLLNRAEAAQVDRLLYGDGDDDD
jgi:hypothetical protein